MEPSNTTSTTTAANQQKVKLIFDMETQDPDDALCLLLACSHPQVDLLAVTITPGTPEQVGVVRHLLAKVLGEHSVAIGAGDLAHGGGHKQCVSPWHYRAFGAVAPSHDAEPATDVLLRLWQPDTCLLTGAPLKNVGALLRRLDAEPALATRQLGRWVAQGGFAGDNVVPPPWRLAKFDGKTAVGTYNFNGDRAAAELALASRRIASKRLCSKNVCHAVFYDADAHQRLRQVLRQTPGTPENKARIVALSLVYSGMGKYLEKKEGKKFHDPLALAAALDDSIMTWRAVSVRQTQPSYWGSVVVPDEQQSLSAAPVQQISVQVDEEAMWRVLLAVSDTHKQGE